MMSARRTTLLRGLAVTVCAALSGSGTIAQQVKISDPTSVLLIVNRDSNELAFMDLESRQLVGTVFLGNNVNPHMGMFTPDGRYAVTGGTRANKAYVIDVATLELVKEIPDGFAPPGEEKGFPKYVFENYVILVFFPTEIMVFTPDWELACPRGSPRRFCRQFHTF